MSDDPPVSTVSIHDSFVYAYSVECEARRIVLHTHFRDGSADEYTDVIFTGVIAHHFEHVLADNILFDVTEIAVRDIVTDFAALFATGTSYCWPDGIEYRNA